MQAKVFGRAMGRSRKVVERTYAQLASRRMDVAQKHIMARMRSAATSDEMTLTIRSAQIPLHQLGAKQNGRGVRVTLRGSYRSAFIAKAGKAQGAVFKRRGTDRLPIRKLFGPNPAGEATRNPATYEEMLGEIANGVFLSEIARGVSFMLGRAG
ncbi:hypothetical protein [Aurantimonas coralicida]|uniref:hypothetical protein n=1 Tax=Aurantimonas coralicida TaxID=182270 RepID=UPI001D191A31|nr:hypothetical protein [Aurantimonas coralicida]MCC4299454.1 hypothetical protein [Aurantimonas coralicida]